MLKVPRRAPVPRPPCPQQQNRVFATRQRVLVLCYVRPLDHIPITQLPPEAFGCKVDHHRRTNEGRERYLVDLLPVFDKVVGRVDVRAGVRAEVNTLDIHAVCRQCQMGA